MALFNNNRVRPVFGKAVRKEFNPSAGGNGLADGRSDARRSEHSADLPILPVALFSPAVASDLPSKENP